MNAKIKIKASTRYLPGNGSKKWWAWYCTNSVATLKGCPTLLYQPGFRTKFELTMLYTQQMNSIHVILFRFTKGCYL